MIPSIKVGTYEGTGAALNVVLGFIPDYVKIINTEDGDAVHEWFKGMGDGTSIATIAAAGPVLNAADGVTPLDSESLGQGFTVGTDISEAAKTFRYVAMRSGPGADSTGAVEA